MAEEGRVIVGSVQMYELKHYFKVDNSNEISEEVDKHCFIDCEFNRGDEAHGTMTLCDGCATWFHTTCVNNKTERLDSGPKQKIDEGDEESDTETSTELWFCPECRAVFTDVPNMKKEIADLRGLIENLSKALKKDASSIALKALKEDGPEEECFFKCFFFLKNASFNVRPNSQNESRRPKDSNNAVTEEIKRLKNENETLRSRLFFISSIKEFTNTRYSLHYHSGPKW